MKNASTYEKKVKKLLGKLKAPHAAEAPTGDAAIAELITAIFEADASRKAGKDALEMVAREFVDFNELRVAPPKDISDRISKDDPNRRGKAVMVTSVLNSIFSRTYDVKLEYMAEMPKRELRRHLLELGLNPYAAACIVLKVFGGHAVPVDETLVEVLKMDGDVHPDSDLADVQGFLERIIAQKDALAAHAFFRTHVEKSAKALAKKRQAEADAAAKAAAEAAARAEAAAKAAAEAAAAKAALAKSRKTAKKTAKKAAGKTAKKTAKKTTKKTSSKAAGGAVAAKTAKAAKKKAKKKTKTAKKATKKIRKPAKKK